MQSVLLKSFTLIRKSSADLDMQARRKETSLHDILTKLVVIMVEIMHVVSRKNMEIGRLFHLSSRKCMSWMDIYIYPVQKMYIRSCRYSSLAFLRYSRFR